MTKEELEKIYIPYPRPIIDESFLKIKNDRTLLWGYTCERLSWHVYIKDLKIHVVTYDIDDVLNERIVTCNHDFVPDKRLYPEACDYEFCKILKQFDIDMPFTCFNPDREPKQYYGKILEDPIEV